MKIFATIYQTKDKRLFTIQNVKLKKLTGRGEQSYWIAEQVFQDMDGSFKMMQQAKSSTSGSGGGTTGEHYGMYQRGETKKDVLKKIEK